MVDLEEQVKGISFVAVDHVVRETADGNRVLIKATLHGEAGRKENELVTAVVKKMVEGFRIYSENDFQTEIQQLLREELEKAETAHAITKKALELEIANRMRAEEKLAKYESLAGRLGEVLRTK